MPEFHRVVCERVGYVCQGCGKDFGADCYFDENGVNQYVCAHHFYTKKARPDLKLETSIGICLDRNCHADVHSGKLKIELDINITPNG